MVKLFSYKKRTFIIYSACCNKIMKCNEDDLIDWNDGFDLSRYIPIKGKCPYCKKSFHDRSVKPFFYAKILEDINSKEEETTNGRSSD